MVVGMAGFPGMISDLKKVVWEKWLREDLGQVSNMQDVACGCPWQDFARCRVDYGNVVDSERQGEAGQPP